MTPAQIVAREEIKGLTPDNIGRRLNTVAEGLLALWAGDDTAAKGSLVLSPMEARLKAMLLLALDTVVRRRQRQLDYELDGFRIRRSGVMTHH